MKKFLMLVIICMFIIGCTSDDPEPTNWDVKTNNKWKIRKEGIIATNVHEIRPFSRSCTIMTFKPDYEKVKIFHMDHSESLKPGDYGILYKHDIGSEDELSWFRLIKKDQ